MLKARACLKSRPKSMESARNPQTPRHVFWVYPKFETQIKPHKQSILMYTPRKNDWWMIGELFLNNSLQLCEPFHRNSVARVWNDLLTHWVDYRSTCRPSFNKCLRSILFSILGTNNELKKEYKHVQKQVDLCYTLFIHNMGVIHCVMHCVIHNIDIH